MGDYYGTFACLTFKDPRQMRRIIKRVENGNWRLFKATCANDQRYWSFAQDTLPALLRKRLDALNSALYGTSAYWDDAEGECVRGLQYLKGGSSKRLEREAITTELQSLLPYLTYGDGQILVQSAYETASCIGTLWYVEQNRVCCSEESPYDPYAMTVDKPYSAGWYTHEYPVPLNNRIVFDDLQRVLRWNINTTK